VLIDPTLKYEIDGARSFPLPSLQLYKGMMENAESLIGGCTSMIIEAGILRKKYLLLAHDDGNPIQSPFDYLRKAEHQSMTTALNNVTVCYDSDNVRSAILTLLKQEVPPTDAILDHIISRKSQRYGEHLSDEINSLLK
jgi:hypothetical protein